MDLASYFAEKEEEKVLPPETGIMKRNASKAEAQAKEEPEYKPYGFLSKFTQMLADSYPNEQAARTGLGLTRTDQVAEDVRMKEIEKYISDASRATAIEDALMGLNLPETPQDMPSAGTLGPLEGAQTLPAAPSVSTSPLGPRSMGTPALTLDEVPTPMSLDPTIMDYANQSSLPDVEAIIDEIMLGRGGEKEITSETGEEREKYRGKGKKKGLMSRRVDGKDGELDFDQDFTNNFVEVMGEREGTEDHTASEGQFTYAYGILPATARGLGVNPEDYENRKDFAKAVYGRMYTNAKNDYSDVFDGMTGKDQQSIMSLYINLGRLPSGVVNALSGETKDFAAAADSLKGVIHYTNRNTNTTYSSKGLSKRRAQEYNALMEGRDGFRRVATVAVAGSQRRPEYVWYDENNEEIKRFTSNHPLSPDNSMDPIAVSE
jgi:hypothetical protein